MPSLSLSLFVDQVKVLTYAARYILPLASNESQKSYKSTQLTVLQIYRASNLAEYSLIAQPCLIWMEVIAFWQE
jgi:hypothetical protein